MADRNVLIMSDAKKVIGIFRFAIRVFKALIYVFTGVHTGEHEEK